MLEISFTGQLKKDYKLCKKCGYNMKLLQDIIDTLAIPEDLPIKNRHSSFCAIFYLLN